MSKVFLSWGSPDKTIATRLAERLQAAKLDVFFSDIDMHAGDDPNDRVVDEMDEAVLSILALSNESVKRDWVMRELTLAWRARRKGKMRRVIPLVVGPLDPDKVPGTIDDEHLHRADFVDLTENFEERLEQLLSTIAEELQTVAPIVIPAAIFAMNAAQFDELCDSANEADIEKIVNSLRVSGAPLGAAVEPDASLAAKRDKIRELFEGVYREQAEDFDPFRDDKGLKALLEGAQRAANDRAARPTHLRWDDERLRDPVRRTEAWFQRDRKARSCLTVVDSLSVFHRDVRELLSETPRPDNKRQDGILWIPPYCLAEIDHATRDLTLMPNRVLDAFLDWSKPTNRWVAFHTSSPNALRKWAVRAVDELSRMGQGPPPPDEDKREVMTERFGYGPSLSDMNRTSGRR